MGTSPASSQTLLFSLRGRPGHTPSFTSALSRHTRVTGHIDTSTLTNKHKGTCLCEHSCSRLGPLLCPNPGTLPRLPHPSAVLTPSCLAGAVVRKSRSQGVWGWAGMWDFPGHYNSIWICSQAPAGASGARMGRQRGNSSSTRAGPPSPLTLWQEASGCPKWGTHDV